MANSPTLDRILDNIRVGLPGALDDAIAREFFEVMGDFCDFSNIWREMIPITTQPDQKCYFVTPSAGFPNRLIGIGLPASNPNDDGTDPPSTIAHGSSAVVGFMTIPGTIELLHTPTVSQELIVELGLTVSDPLARNGFPLVPEWILTKYRQYIIAGVMGRMMSQLAKPYSNPQMALVRLKQFNAGKSVARVEAMQHNTYRAQAWRFPQTMNNMRSRQKG